MSLNASLGLLLMRLALGAIMIAHGLQKCFGFFGGQGVEPLQRMIAEQHELFREEIVGFQGAEVLAWLVALGELLGGALVVLGLFARFGAFWFVVIMAGAIGMVHWQNGFFLENGGFELNLALIGLALGLLFLGPGEFAVLPPKSLRRAVPRNRDA